MILLHGLFDFQHGIKCTFFRLTVLLRYNQLYKNSFKIVEIRSNKHGNRQSG
jgi:hypothetical protein